MSKDMVINMISAGFGDRLRFIIDNHFKISHRDFAALIGVSRNYLSEIVNSKRTPGVDFLQALLSLENIDEQFLFHGVGSGIIDPSKSSINKFDYLTIFGSEENFRKFLFYLFESQIFQNDCMSHLMMYLVKNREIIKEELILRGIDESSIPRL